MPRDQFSGRALLRGCDGRRPVLRQDAMTSAQTMQNGAARTRAPRAGVTVLVLATIAFVGCAPKARLTPPMSLASPSKNSFSCWAWMDLTAAGSRCSHLSFSWT